MDIVQTQEIRSFDFITSFDFDLGLRDEWMFSLVYFMLFQIFANCQSINYKSKEQTEHYVISCCCCLCHVMKKQMFHADEVDLEE